MPYPSTYRTAFRLGAIPNLNVFRPADRIETIECWEHALKGSKTL